MSAMSQSPGGRDAVQVRIADLADAGDCAAIVQLIDAYARDPRGGGKSLPSPVRERLIAGLRTHPTTRVWLAFAGGRWYSGVAPWESRSSPTTPCTRRPRCYPFLITHINHSNAAGPLSRGVFGSPRPHAILESGPGSPITLMLFYRLKLEYGG